MDIDSLRERADAGFRKLGFVQYAGIRHVEQTDGRNIMTMAARPEHLNHNGDLHAAVLFGLAETAAMGAAISGILDLIADTYIVTSGATIEYVARAQGSNGPYTATSHIPDKTYATARTDVRQRRPVDLQVPYIITDTDGKAVARGTFTAVIRPRRT